MSQINVNTITGKDGGSAVNFPHGITVTGVVTATSLNQNVSGNITATSFTGDLTGDVTGNLTGNVTGNLNGNVTSSGAHTLGSLTVSNDATVQGNLTVNGTTTTIDTAVTAVDSLAVDGSVGIGTTNPSVNLHVAAIEPQVYIQDSNSTGNNVNATLQFRDSANSQLSYFGYASTSDSDLSLFNTMSGGALRFGTGGTERVVIDVNGTTKFKGPLTEKCHYDTGGGLQSDYHHNLITHGNVYWSDTAAAGAFTFNLRGSATVALNDMMSVGESLSFWLAHACHSDTSRYLTIFKVDNADISGSNIIWAGGSAPTSAGGGSGTKDVYTFTVFKVGNASFRAFAAQTNHA